MQWTSSLAPLLDVLFLLVIFLLVSANFDSRQVLEVELPEAKTAEAAPRVAEEHLRVITLHADGSLTFNGTPVTTTDLIEDLRDRPEEERLLPVSIQGDATAPLGLGLGLLDLLRDLGYRNCAFEVRPSR